MRVTIDSAQIARLKAAIEGTAFELRKELRIAVNATARRSQSIIAKHIASEIVVTQKVIKKTIRISRGASITDLTSTVEVDKEKRLNLKEFKARQTKAGVSFKVSKSAGVMHSPSAFIAPKFGGNVYVRAFKDKKKRGPLKQRRGLSPWGVFTSGEKIGPAASETEAELKKQIDKRIRYIGLKSSGVIK